MGNVALCIPKQHGVVFGDFPQQGRLAIQPFRQLAASADNLRTVSCAAAAEGSAGGVGSGPLCEDHPLIFGLELVNGSVSVSDTFLIS